MLATLKKAIKNIVGKAFKTLKKKRLLKFANLLPGWLKYCIFDYPTEVVILFKFQKKVSCYLNFF